MALIRTGDHLDVAGDLDGHRSQLLGIRFERQSDELVVLYPDGRPFLSFEEVMARAEGEAANAQREAERAEREAERAEREAERAEREAERAEREAERAERLAARLRELGIEVEPDT